MLLRQTMAVVLVFISVIHVSAACADDTQTDAVVVFEAPVASAPATEPVAVDTLPAVDPVAAEKAQGGLGWELAFHITGGGDDVSFVIYTDGTSDTITAGEGFGFSAGGHYRVPGSRFDLSALAGMKLAQIVSQNASLEINRTTLELRGDFYVTDDLWLGLGPVMHRNIKATFDGFIPDIRMQDANGKVFKIGWKWFALTHTQMEYIDDFGFVYDATASGLEFVGKF